MQLQGFIFCISQDRPTAIKSNSKNFSWLKRIFFFYSSLSSTDHQGLCSTKPFKDAGFFCVKSTLFSHQIGVVVGEQGESIRKIYGPDMQVWTSCSSTLHSLGLAAWPQLTVRKTTKYCSHNQKEKRNILVTMTQIVSPIFLFMSLSELEVFISLNDYSVSILPIRLYTTRKAFRK